MFTPYSSLNIGGGMAASGAKAAAESARTEVGMLRYEIERLLMITEALWDILKEKHGYEDEELVARVNEIDMRDGKLDGKVAAGERGLCHNCHRPVSGRRPICIYCGATIGRKPFER
ncbi:MAG: hypothetical protein GXP25_03825 [Planctomycetes bacterium]|nr:hypothetical protein [Planctomycetota bacterium]